MINLDDKKLKEQIGFHYLLTEILLFTLIFLELNIMQNQRSISYSQYI